MKGVIKLIDIGYPVEGMTVAIDSKNHPNAKSKYTGEILRIHPDNGCLVNSSWYDISELKQLAVEYKEKNWDFLFERAKEILPLYPDDYPVAIALIGHTMKFEIKDFSLGKETQEGGMYIRAVHIGKVAKLSLPTPVRTIEDIPEELRKNYPEGWPIKNKISTLFLGNLIRQYDKEEISLSRMAELINKKVSQYDTLSELTNEEETWDDIEKKLKKSLGGKLNKDELEVLKWFKNRYQIPKRK